MKVTAAVLLLLVATYLGPPAKAEETENSAEPDSPAAEAAEEEKEIAEAGVTNVESESIENPKDREPLANEKLIKDLFQNGYRRDAIPGNVSLYLGLGYLCAQYDPQTHILKSRVWQFMMWNDKRLRWNPRDYEGVTHIQTEVWYVWHPDIQLYNSIERDEPDWSTRALIYFTGDVIYVPPVTYSSLCGTHDRTISCKLEFGSWTHDATAIDIRESTQALHTDRYYAECPYNITNVKSHIARKKYDCCDEPYVTLEAEFDLSKN